MDDDNIYHKIASWKKWEKLTQPYYTLFTKADIVEKLNEINDEGETPLDTAIDYSNWDVVQLFIQFNISKDTIVKAIGNLLSDYWHTGSSTYDKFIFQLILKKGYLTKDECNYLLTRALDGNAWPYIIPFLNCSDLSLKEMEEHFHWQVEDNPLLKPAVIALLKKLKKSNISRKSIFIYSDNILRIDQASYFRSNEKYLSSFIFKRRRIVGRRVKKNVRLWLINYKLIKGLIYMYAIE